MVGNSTYICVLSLSVYHYRLPRLWLICGSAGSLLHGFHVPQCPLARSWEAAIPDASTERAPLTCIRSSSSPGASSSSSPEGILVALPLRIQNLQARLILLAATSLTLTEPRPTLRAALDALARASPTSTASVGWRSYVVGLGNVVCRH